MDENFYPQENVYGQTTETEKGCHIPPVAGSYLASAAKWAKFIAIMGFIGCGLMAIMGMTAGLWMSALSSASDIYGGAGTYAGGSVVLTITYLIMAVVYFFLAWYLYRFGVKTQQALAQNGELTEAFANLKNLFQLYGIIIIISLAFVVLALVFIFLGALFTTL